MANVQQKPPATKQHRRQFSSDGCPQWSKCMITLHYFGSAASRGGPQTTGRSSRLDTIVVKQHCCGASVRTVFEQNVAPKSMYKVQYLGTW